MFSESFPNPGCLMLATATGNVTAAPLPCAGRSTPSVACVVQPGSTGFQKVFFGNEEIAIPVASRSV